MKTNVSEPVAADASVEIRQSGTKLHDGYSEWSVEQRRRMAARILANGAIRAVMNETHKSQEAATAPRVLMKLDAVEGGAEPSAHSPVCPQAA